MLLTKSRIGVLGSALLVAGCSFASDSLWPTFGLGGDPAPAAAAVSVPPVQTVAAAEDLTLTPGAPPELGQTNFVPTGVTRAQSTGTFVGQKVAQHRGELQSLQGTIVQHNSSLQSARQVATANSQRYHGTIAAINTRLQLGTTPGNPVLTNQWRAAQQELERLSQDVAQLNSLANNVASDSSMAAYLLEAARATYGLAGAIDEDHRQLAILEDETNRTVVLIDRLLSELSEDISRQTTYIGVERRNLNTMALAIQNGEILGSSLFNRAFASASSGTSGGVSAPGFVPAIGANQQPLVVIRFDRPDVQYEQPLYNAISAALERRPQAVFELVAVASMTGTSAEAALNVSRSKQNADSVVRNLADMGLPADRLRLSSTSSGDISTNEVRIYVR